MTKSFTIGICAVVVAGLFSLSCTDYVVLFGRDGDEDHHKRTRFIEIIAASIGLSFPRIGNDHGMETPLLNNATDEYPGQLVLMQNTRESLETATGVVVEFSGINHTATELHVYPYPPHPPYYCPHPFPALTRPSMGGTAPALATICPYFIPHTGYADPIAVRIDNLRPPSSSALPRIIDNLPSIAGPGTNWEAGRVGGGSVEFGIDFWISVLSGELEGWFTLMQGFVVNDDGVQAVPSPLDHIQTLGLSQPIAIVPRESGRAGLVAATDLLVSEEHSLSYFSPDALDNLDPPEVIPFSLLEVPYNMPVIESCGGFVDDPPRFLLFGTGKIQSSSTIGSNAGLSIVDMDNFKDATTTWLPMPVSVDVVVSSIACGDYDDDGIRDIAAGVFSTEQGTLPGGAMEGAFVLWGNEQGEFETDSPIFLELPVCEDRHGEPCPSRTYVAGGPLLNPDQDDLVVVSSEGGTIRIYPSSQIREWY